MNVCYLNQISYVLSACPPDHIYCDNKCLPPSVLCDGVEDCTNSSIDEPSYCSELFSRMVKNPKINYLDTCKS